jgi:hypothetical protein
LRTETRAPAIGWPVAALVTLPARRAEPSRRASTVVGPDWSCVQATTKCPELTATSGAPMYWSRLIGLATNREDIASPRPLKLRPSIRKSYQSSVSGLYVSAFHATTNSPSLAGSVATEGQATDSGATRKAGPRAAPDGSKA